MRLEWEQDKKDKKDKSLQRYLASIGCPSVGKPWANNLRGDVWKGPGDVSNAELRKESSEEEMVEAGAGCHDEPEATRHYDTDDELWFEDWMPPNRTVCRGEQEQVLGREWSKWDPAAWALAANAKVIEEDPSERKQTWCEGIKVGAPTHVDVMTGDGSIVPPLGEYMAAPMSNSSVGA